MLSVFFLENDKDLLESLIALPADGLPPNDGFPVAYAGEVLSVLLMLKVPGQYQLTPIQIWQLPGFFQTHRLVVGKLSLSNIQSLSFLISQFAPVLFGLLDRGVRDNRKHGCGPVITFWAGRIHQFIVVGVQALLKGAYPLTDRTSQFLCPPIVVIVKMSIQKELPSSCADSWEAVMPAGTHNNQTRRKPKPRKHQDPYPPTVLILTRPDPMLHSNELFRSWCGFWSLINQVSAQNRLPGAESPVVDSPKQHLL